MTATPTPFHSGRLPTDIPPQVGDLAASVFFDDFYGFTAADWTITTSEVGTGSATEAVTPGAHGILLVTNAAGDDDHDFFQKVSESFTFETGKRVWFGVRFKTSDATDSDLVFGLQITDTTPLAATDGVWFQKDDGDTEIDFHVTKDSVSTDATAIGTLADDTWITLGFLYDGANAIIPYVNGAAMTPSVITNMPDDEELTVSFGLQNGEAVAKTLSVDYVYAAQER